MHRVPAAVVPAAQSFPEAAVVPAVAQAAQSFPAVAQAVVQS